MLPSRHSNELKHCFAKGFLVNGEEPLSEDPSEFAPHSILFIPQVGCNNLRCHQCGEKVRNRAGVKLEGSSISEAELDTLYTTTDWTTADAVKTSISARLYLCRCQSWTELLTNPLVDPDPDPWDAPVPLWSCHGHPPPTLPVEIDGISINQQTDWSNLVGRIFDGWLPKHLERLSFYEVWLARLYERLQGTASANSLAKAVGKQFSSGISHRIAAAFKFYARNPDAPGFEQLLAFANKAPTNTIYNMKSVNGSWEVSITTPLYQRLVKSPKGSSDYNTCAGHIKKLCLEPSLPIDGDALTALAKLEPEWVARHLGEIVAKKSVPWMLIIHSLARQETAHAAIAGVSVVRDGNIATEELKSWASVSNLEQRDYGMVILQALNAR